VDLSVFCQGVHLHAYDCLPIRTLRILKAAMFMPGDPRVEFTTHSITNLDKITCIHCWKEHGSPGRKEVFVNTRTKEIILK
jgi:hypothetical protein